MNALIVVLSLAAAAAPQDPEAVVVEYLKAHVRPGEPVVVSDLYNKVFTAPEQRAVLNRLFNTFFKIPLFVAQYQKASGKAPTLREIGEQFHFQIPGETEVMLRIMESDPRMPRFLERDPRSGEITRVDVDAILAHPRFGKSLERTIAGFEGKPAPAFEIEGYDGQKLTSGSLAGKPHLLYFWFTNCPPCLATSPLLVELHRKHGPLGFEFVAVNADRVLDLPFGDEVRASYTKKVGIVFPQGHLSEAMQDAYGSASVFPTIFVIDGKGTIVKHFVNAPDKASLDAAIALALGAGSTR